jgi:hypothetical protein
LLWEDSLAFDTGSEMFKPPVVFKRALFGGLP